MGETKDIFNYKAQGKDRFGDPVALLSRLHACAGGDVNDLIRQSQSRLPAVRFPAAERLALAVCQAFKLGDAWNDETGLGVMEAEWRGVLEDFTGFVAKNGPRADSPPTSPASTASAS